MKHDEQPCVRAALGGMHRRRFLTLTGGMAGAAILAACGGARTATDTPRPTGSVGTISAAATIASSSPTTNPVRATTIPGSAVAGATSIGSLPTLAIEAFDFGYRTLGSIPGGPTRVQMRNTGTEPHHAQFMLLNPGVTLDQLGAAFAKGPDAAFALVTFPGGPGAVLPGGGTEVILTLAEGQYMLACFIAGADHIPHLAKGMLLPLKVTTAPTPAASLPAVNGAITLYDFTFTMPDTLPAGRSMYTVANTGAQFHEFSINRLPPGKTMGDVTAYFASTMPPAEPPPIIPMGGMNALTKGSTGIAVLDLAPGDYVAICNVPDQSRPNGDSHAHLGMMKAFTVR